MLTKIVLTGGPGSGKTTILNHIKEKYQKEGYQVFIVPETATTLINNGLKPFGLNPLDILTFQKLVLKYQLAEEEFYSYAQKQFPNSKILIIYDRGLLDNSAYISDSEFMTLLAPHNLDIPHIISRYDLVIGLISSPEFYTTKNNQARTEDLKTALKLGTKTLNCWLTHPSLKLISPQDTIETKTTLVLSLIDKYLAAKNFKHQTKYLIDRDHLDLDFISHISKQSFIIQHYLSSPKNIEKRIRKITTGPTTTYHFAIYKETSPDSKIIIQDEEITPKMYNYFLNFQDHNYNSLTKTRYYFNYQDKSLYLDVFSNPQFPAIAEINHPCLNTKLPDFLPEIKCSPTSDRLFNKILARKKENPTLKLTP